MIKNCCDPYEEAKRMLNAVGGTISFNGKLRTGDEAVRVILAMSDQDRKSLADDIALLNEQNSFGCW